jgi:RNA-directed DNA polymerase
MDYRIHCKLWKWARRRHPTKGAKWINKKYFPPTEKWGYFAASQKVGSDKTETIHLVGAGKIPIQRHREIKNASNPSDPCWPTYFQERQTWQLLKRLAKRPDWAALWKRQGGNCPVGKQRITKKMPWDLHHLHPKKEGGSDNPSNLLMLPPNCHRQVHNNTSVARWLTIMIERKEA